MIITEGDLVRVINPKPVHALMRGGIGRVEQTWPGECLVGFLDSVCWFDCDELEPQEHPGRSAWWIKPKEEAGHESHGQRQGDHPHG